MADLERVSIEEARKKVSGGKAQFVCAYEDYEKFKEMHLRWGMSLHEFVSILPFISQRQEVIFYCDSPNETEAVRWAEEFRTQGFKDVKILAGGAGAWKEAGYAYYVHKEEDDDCPVGSGCKQTGA